MQEKNLSKITVYKFSRKPLNSDERKKLDLFSYWAARHSYTRMKELQRVFNIKRQFAILKYKSYSEFAFDELFKAIEEFVRVDLLRLSEIEFIPIYLQDSKEAKSNQIDIAEPLSVEQISTFLWEIFITNALLNDYMKIDISIFPLRDYYPNTLKWKDFDKIIEFFGQLRWLTLLNHMIQTKAFDEPVEIVKEKRTLSDIALQFCWEDKIINRQNKDSIALNLSSNGIILLKNGNRLYYDYCTFNKKCNRIADQGNDRKNKQHLILMNRALKYLSSDKHLNTAIQEILTFKGNAEKISGTIL